MTNNLRGIRKGLCAFAKKCKSFKYTDSALITFLITGAVSVSSNLFSAEKDGNIEKQKQILSTDIKDFNVLIKEARKENNNLELTICTANGMVHIKEEEIKSKI